MILERSILFFLERILKNESDDSVEKIYWKKYFIGKNIQEVYHTYVSFDTVYKLTKKDYLAEIVGMHHGYPLPSNRHFNVMAMGGNQWELVREEIARKILRQMAMENLTFPLPHGRNAKRVLLESWLGLVVVSDWISSQVNYPLPEGEERKTAKELVAKAGFRKVDIPPTLDFSQVFGFSPRRAQAVFLDKYAGPGVYVLEAPTGYGKTEAALGLAFAALARGDASGIYFALPTQLTSNRIFDRFQRVISHIAPTSESAKLIHGGAALLAAQMGKEAAPGGTWFSENRRALLAPFGVGTVDQALLSEISVKFSSVRTAGLLGKVVIFDEIHSYDAYTSTLIADLIERLELMGNVVIILSATLTTDARNKLLKIENREDVDSYPVIRITTKLKDEIKEDSVPINENESKKVHIDLLTDQAAKRALAEVLKRVQHGEQVLWIENTVAEAQKVYQYFCEHHIEAGLLHSRFRPVDRECLENRWTTLYGKEGWKERGMHGRVLVGTQILEQSLDLDADFLVTRLAPFDLLVQRMGRLWRHQNTPRPQSCQHPSAMILVEPESEASRKKEFPENIFGKSAFVYKPPYVLWRTWDVLQKRFPQQQGELTLPQEVGVYSEREETDEQVLKLKKDFIDTNKKLSSLAKGAQSLLSLAEDSEAEPSTRYIDARICEMLVLTSEDIKNCPVDFAKLALFLERRLVKTYVPIRNTAPDLKKLNNLVLQNFLEKSKRFSSIPAFLQNDDGVLQALFAEEIIHNFLYTDDIGLVEQH